MADKRLKHMSRRELLELLIAQMEENEELKNSLAKAEKELENRRIVMENAGSLAEAALALSGIFEAADRAVKLYQDNVCSDEKGGENRS